MSINIDNPLTSQCLFNKAHHSKRNEKLILLPKFSLNRLPDQYNFSLKTFTVKVFPTNSLQKSISIQDCRVIPKILINKAKPSCWIQLMNPIAESIYWRNHAEPIRFTFFSLFRWQPAEHPPAAADKWRSGIRCKAAGMGSAPVGFKKTQLKSAKTAIEVVRGSRTTGWVKWFGAKMRAKND